AEIAAAVHGQDLEPGMAREHAVEDEIMQRERRLERIADHIVEIEPRQALCLGETVGMDHDERAELLGLLPERRERRIRQLAAADIGQDLGALEAKLLHAALEFARRLLAVLQRHAAERDEA